MEKKNPKQNSEEVLHCRCVLEVFWENVCYTTAMPCSKKYKKLMKSTPLRNYGFIKISKVLKVYLYNNIRDQVNTRELHLNCWSYKNLFLYSTEWSMLDPVLYWLFHCVDWSHTGDLSCPIVLLEATLLQLWQGVRIAPSKQRESLSSPWSGRDLVCTSCSHPLIHWVTGLLSPSAATLRHIKRQKATVPVFKCVLFQFDINL